MGGIVRAGRLLGGNRGLSSSGPAPTVSDQAFDYGVKSAALAGAYTIAPVSGTISSIVIDSGNTGTVYDTTGDQIRLAAGKTATTLTLGCTATFSDASTDTFTATITGTANEIHVTGTGGATTEFDAAAIALVSGDSIVIRQDAVLGGLNAFPATGEVWTIRGDIQATRAQAEWIYIKNTGTGADFTLQDIEWTNPRGQASSRNSHVYIDYNGDTFTSTRCLYTGPFTPATNAETDYLAKITYLSGTGVPVIGRTYTNGANVAETLAVDDNGDGTGTLWFSNTTSEGGDSWTSTQVLTESVSGDTITVDTAYHGGLPDAQQSTGINMTNGNTNWNNVVLTDDEYVGCTEAVKIKVVLDAIVSGITITSIYGDGIKVDPKTLSAPPTYNISDVTGYGSYTTPYDYGDAHADWVQVEGASITDDMAGTIENSSFIEGDGRGNNCHGLLLGGTASGNMVAQIRNIFFSATNVQQGIAIAYAQGCGIHNNTIVHQDPDNASGDSVIMTIFITTDGGGNTAYNNVCDAFSIASATTGNNITLGKGGVTIDYSTAFDTEDFSGATPDNSAAIIDLYTPKPSGPLLAGASYVIGDAGCVNQSGLLEPWDADSLPYSETLVTFDGTNDYLKRTTAVGSDGAACVIFISCIMKDITNSGYLWGWEQSSANVDTGGLLWRTDITKFKMILEDASNSSIVNANCSTTHSDDERLNIFIEMSTDHVRIIINGTTELDSSQSSPTYPIGNPNNWLCGYQDANEINVQTARMCMWDSAAFDPTSSGVRDNFYNSGTGVTVNPATSVAAYGTPVYDIYGSVAEINGATNDKSGNGNHFTITGAVT